MSTAVCFAQGWRTVPVSVSPPSLPNRLQRTYSDAKLYYCRSLNHQSDVRNHPWDTSTFSQTASPHCQRELDFKRRDHVPPEMPHKLSVCRHIDNLSSQHSPEQSRDHRVFYALIYAKKTTRSVNGHTIFLLRQSVSTLNPHRRLIYSSIPPFASKSLMLNDGVAHEISPQYSANYDKSSRTSTSLCHKWPSQLQSAAAKRKTAFCNKCKWWKEEKKWACGRGIDFCDELVRALSTVRLLIYECANFQVFGLAV